jgi:hypothetical protein
MNDNPEPDKSTSMLLWILAGVVALCLVVLLVGDRWGKLLPAALGGTGGSAAPTTGRGIPARGATRPSVPQNVVIYDDVTYTFTTLAGKAGLSGSADGIGSEARFSTPISLTLDAEGNVFVSDLRNYTVRRITPAGAVSTVAGISGVRRDPDVNPISHPLKFFAPGAIAVDPKGNLYVNDSNIGVLKITPAGVASIAFTSAGGIVIDRLGNIYNRNGFQKIGPTGETTSLSLNLPLGGIIGHYTVDQAGDWYFADNQHLSILKARPSGQPVMLAGRKMGMIRNGQYQDGAGEDAVFGGFTGMTVDAMGNVFVTSQDTIRKITPTGWVTTLAGSPGLTGSADGIGKDARFNRAASIAVDAAGNIYVADTRNHTIRKGVPSAPKAENPAR